MRALAALAFAGLAACGPALPEPEEREHPMGDPRAAMEGRIVEEFPEPADPWPETIRGDWRLAGIDGEPFEADYGVAIHIGQDRIEFDNCQQIAWNYTHKAEKVTTRRTPAITIDIKPKPLPCAAPLEPEIASMVAAIDAASEVRRTPENGIQLSGGSHSVTLFSQ